MSEVRAYPRHARQVGFCFKECRRFFVLKGLDWNEFINGMPVSKLYNTGDARAKHVADTAVQEARNGIV